MQRIINSYPSTPIEKYEKAFYLASYGKWDEAYIMYSSLLRETDVPQDRLLHYLTLLNRYWVYQAIKQSSRHFGTVGILTYGARYQPFTNKFLERMNIEMENFEINDVFNDMPIEYQEKFKPFKYLADPKFLYDDIIKLNELTQKAQSSFRKNTVTLGGLTPFHEVQIRLNDVLKFVYENKLWISSFNEIKNFTRNSMRLLFENANYDITKEPGEFDFGYESQAGNYYIDYTDYVNICKSFTKEEIQYAESVCRIGRFTFRDNDKIEAYIARISNELVKHYSGDGMHIVFYNLIINEAKNAIYFARYVELSQKCVLNILNMLLNYFPLITADYGERYRWMRAILNKNDYPIEATKMIESYLVKQAKLRKNPKYVEHSTTRVFSWDFARIIKIYDSKFQSIILSNLALDLNSDNQQELIYFYHLVDILTPKAKEHIISLKEVNGIGDFLDSIDLGIVDDLDKYKDQIIKLLDERINEIKTNKAKGIITGYGDDFPLTVAIWKYLGYVDNPKLLDYLGIIDEYDMFVNPESFDFDKFKPRWVKKYSINLLDKISKDERIKDKILNQLIERIKMTHDKRYIDIVFEFFI